MLYNNRDTWCQCYLKLTKNNFLYNFLEHVSTSTKESWKITIVYLVDEAFETEPVKFPWHGFY